MQKVTFHSAKNATWRAAPKRSRLSIPPMTTDPLDLWRDGTPYDLACRIARETGAGDLEWLSWLRDGIPWETLEGWADSGVDDARRALRAAWAARLAPLLRAAVVPGASLTAAEKLTRARTEAIRELGMSNFLDMWTDLICASELG